MLIVASSGVLIDACLALERHHVRDTIREDVPQSARRARLCGTGAVLMDWDHFDIRVESNINQDRC
jgi:hypothetical protein